MADGTRGNLTQRANAEELPGFLDSSRGDQYALVVRMPAARNHGSRGRTGAASGAWRYWRRRLLVRVILSTAGERRYARVRGMQDILQCEGLQGPRHHPSLRFAGPSQRLVMGVQGNRWHGGAQRPGDPVARAKTELYRHHPV